MYIWVKEMVLTYQLTGDFHKAVRGTMSLHTLLLLSLSFGATQDPPTPLGWRTDMPNSPNSSGAINRRWVPGGIHPDPLTTWGRKGLVFPFVLIPFRSSLINHSGQKKPCWKAALLLLGGGDATAPV